jgi:hypothetical protein
VRVGLWLCEPGWLKASSMLCMLVGAHTPQRLTLADARRTQGAFPFAVSRVFFALSLTFPLSNTHPHSLAHTLSLFLSLSLSLSLSLTLFERVPGFSLLFFSGLSRALTRAAKF